MQYLLLIYMNEALRDQAKPDELNQIMQEYKALTESMAKSGNLRAVERLQPVSTATTVRIRNGKTQITDGPFAETREQLGGFYLIEADNLDQAIAIASRIPTVRDGSIEVRPLLTIPQASNAGANRP